MNPTDIIFQTVSTLTGGLITDMTTLIIGLVTVAFILMGLDLLMDVFNHAMDNHAKNKARNEYWAEANNAGVNFEEDEKQAKYEQARSDYKKHL